MKTKDVVLEMMRENTGKHFLDSGSAYGRHFEKNQKLSDDDLMNNFYLSLWKDKETGKTCFDGMYISVYQYIINAYSFSDEYNKSFHDWVEVDDPKQDKNWFQNVEEWFIANNYSHSEQSYTYSESNCLSQDVVMWFFDPDYNIGETEGYTHAIIMLHNGCDARGGFTVPKVFEMNDDHSYYYYDNVTIFCDDCDCGSLIDYSKGECLDREGKVIHDLSLYVTQDENDRVICAKCGNPMLAELGVC